MFSPYSSIQALISWKEMAMALWIYKNTKTLSAFKILFLNSCKQTKISLPWIFLEWSKHSNSCFEVCCLLALEILPSYIWFNPLLIKQMSVITDQFCPRPVP